MGTEPVPEEIPVEFEDLCQDIQEAYNIYQMFQDNWDTMNGNYLGKNFTGLLDILALHEVEDRKLTFNLLKKIDECRSSNIAEIKARKSAQ